MLKYQNISLNAFLTKTGVFLTKYTTVNDIIKNDGIVYI